MSANNIRPLRVLNLYAGIGGNRQRWGGNIQVTAVEYNPDIAKVYQEFYPQDIVIVGDAHEYLLKHYKEFDFIWASPPCPTHSRLVISNQNMFYNRGDMHYPDMKLYQEIILLKSFAPDSCKWVIENVVPYYDYLIKPTVNLHRHPFWSNFKIPFREFEDDRVHDKIEATSTVYGVNVKDCKNVDRRLLLRNMVNPEVGEYIFNCMLEKEIQVQGGLF